ncbi:hypothetical protein CAOG_08638 [Capsaspora owczarzaki ATCC 30864]|uniref:Peptidase M28 domain-containing protein n=1 Tax=Capsaspora owczarzaki (strain ATCC 30864) TaxID=595528 RepID=A0A0D2VN99_CAPO3|nr:hypothetical protein CAOG_08638 [Capsaspora owczarzaki ATCC 30864]KJE91757.1 hypothetical protein CAOG_008638 [Capsaspora owczarzaki ATCC 30864]|eukprot:XP_011270249.1 hypothetical protein CAOG_08638 [Capsaspora owczarzaki ATCC 30864]
MTGRSVRATLAAAAAALCLACMLLATPARAVPAALLSQQDDASDSALLQRVILCSDMHAPLTNTPDTTAIRVYGSSPLSTLTVLVTRDPAALDVDGLRSAGCQSPTSVPLPAGHAAFLVNFWRVATVDKAIGLQALSKLAEIGGRATSLVGDAHLSLVTLPHENVLALEQLLVDAEKERLIVAPAVSTRLSEKLELVGAFAAPVTSDIVDRLDGERYLGHLAKLTGVEPFTLPATGSKEYTIKTRMSTTSDNALAADFLAAHCSALGLQVEFQTLKVSGKETRNVVCKHLGRVTPSKIVVVGAHFDSTSQSAATLAPGAVDNGSGTAGVMAIAEVIADVQFNHTIHLVFFTGEEQGLYGSQHYVDQAVKAKLDITCALIMDMIGYSDLYFGVMVEGTRDAPIQTLMTNVVANMKVYAPALDVSTSSNSFGSDHIPFQRANIPAILAIEQDDTDYPSYHRTTDTVSNVNEAQSIAILRGLTGTLISAAGVLNATISAI